jgi:hypothetical protein
MRANAITTTLLIAALSLLASPVAAQTADATLLTTPAGQEVSASVGRYTYIEPGDIQISIHGLKAGGEYTGTWSLSERAHWFASVNARGSAGSMTYDGWCQPWLIVPSSRSPNGYALDLGDPSACSETGDLDGHLDARGLIGKDLRVGAWGLAPETGVGLRYLSNGTTGVVGFRTDTYLYVPVGLTARTRVAPRRAISFHGEFDALVRGWQKTRDSALGGGDIPATPTTPAFTLNGLTDLAFPQHRGWALRASVKYPLSRRWSVEPSYVYWHVSASPVEESIASFTVNGITAQQSLGAYEPDNVTHDLFVNLAFHF